VQHVAGPSPFDHPEGVFVVSKNKQKGTAFERSIADALALHLDDRIDRAPLRGTKDRGDIANVRSPFGKVAIECKHVARLDLAGWVAEAEVERGNLDGIAGAVVHKRRGKGDALDQYVTMTLRDFLALGWGIRP
jgi:hypothetical protein